MDRVIRFFWYLHGFPPEKAEALASWCTVLLLVFTACFAYRTWKQTKRQADSAEQQVKEAKEQTLAALSQKDNAARPVLRIIMVTPQLHIQTVELAPLNATSSDTVSQYQLRNVGAFATNIGVYELADNPATDRAIETSEEFLGAGIDLIGKISVVDGRLLVVHYTAAGTGGHFLSLAKNRPGRPLKTYYIDPRLPKHRELAARMMKRIETLDQKEPFDWI